MPRGGRRTGTPGASYSNRTDLQSVKPMAPQAATGQAYGAAGAQLASQKVVPIARPATDAMPAPGASAAPAPPMALPGSVTPLDAPSTRPGEPVTAGMDMGAGAGASANPFSNVGSEDDALLGLRAAYSVYPSEELRMLLERADL